MMKRGFLMLIIFTVVLIVLYYQSRAKQLEKEAAKVAALEAELAQCKTKPTGSTTNPQPPRSMTYLYLASLLEDKRLYGFSVGQLLRENKQAIDTHLSSKGVVIKGVLY